MSSFLETIPEGKAMKQAVEGLFASRYLPPQSRLEVWGAVRKVRVIPAPGAEAVTIVTDAYIVSGHAHRMTDEIVIYGTVSWSDQGMARVIAGQIYDAESTALTVLLPEGSATEAPGPMAPPAPAPPTPAKASKPPEKKASVPPVPAAEPAPAEPSWSDAVNASTDTQQAPPAPRPASQSGQLDAEGVPQFKRGDIVIHPRYGRCAVVRTPKFHKLKLKRTTGAFFDLHLKVCRFDVEADDDGRAVYRVHIVGRGEAS